MYLSPLQLFGCDWGKFGANEDPAPASQVSPSGHSLSLKHGKEALLLQNPQWHQWPQVTGWSGNPTQAPLPKHALSDVHALVGSSLHRRQSAFDAQAARLSVHLPLLREG